jgi:hypothetical protein
MILNLGAFLMALLIVYYLIIWLIQEMYFCLQCYIKHQVPTHAKKKKNQSHVYMCAILLEHSFIQLLSFVNIGLHIQN